MSSKYEHIRIPAQDDDGIDPFAAAKQDIIEDQDPDHFPPDAISGTSFLPEQTIPGWQRRREPLIALARIDDPIEPRFIGSASTTLSEAMVTQVQRIAGAIVWNPETGQFSLLDLGTARRTNANADHVPARGLGEVDLAEATETYLGAGNKRRIPIGGRPEVTLITKEDA